MARIDLHVPFAKKDEAKRLGTKWDAEWKAWYIPDSIVSTPFKRWMKSTAEYNHRARSFFLGVETRLVFNLQKGSFPSWALKNPLLALVESSAIYLFPQSNISAEF